VALNSVPVITDTVSSIQASQQITSCYLKRKHLKGNRKNTEQWTFVTFYVKYKIGLCKTVLLIYIMISFQVLLESHGFLRP